MCTYSNVYIYVLQTKIQKQTMVSSGGMQSGGMMSSSGGLMSSSGGMMSSSGGMGGVVQVCML